MDRIRKAASDLLWVQEQLAKRGVTVIHVETQAVKIFNDLWYGASRDQVFDDVWNLFSTTQV